MAGTLADIEPESWFFIMGGLFMIALIIGLAFSPNGGHGVTTPSATTAAIDACRKAGGVPITSTKDSAVIMTDCKRVQKGE